MTSAFGRVSVHGVRAEVLHEQEAALGLRSITVEIPYPCPNSIYEEAMNEALRTMRDRDDITHVIFGDLFLRDIRTYRESQLAALGLRAVFPLWMRDTMVLARDMVNAGLEARIVALDPRKLDRSFAGGTFAELLAALPAGVDPCGENGEFHTCVTDGPMFRTAIRIAVGDIVERDGIVFADLIPTEKSHSAPNSHESEIR